LVFVVVSFQSYTQSYHIFLSVLYIFWKNLEISHRFFLICFLKWFHVFIYIESRCVGERNLGSALGLHSIQFALARFRLFFLQSSVLSAPHLYCFAYHSVIIPNSLRFSSQTLLFVL
jgi:hypothetical protein